MTNKEALLQLGIDEEDINVGNCGFEIEDMEGYFLREAMENRRESGFQVPEEFQPQQKSRKERDMYRRTKDMERMEQARVERQDLDRMWGARDEEEDSGMVSFEFFDFKNRKAIINLNKALELDSKLADAYCSRGIAYCKLGNYQEGIMDLNQAIELDPKDTLAFINRGVAYGKLGNNQRAIMDFRTAARLGSQTAQDWLSAQGLDW